MSVNVLSRTGAVEKGQWCDLVTSAIDYIFPLNNVRANILVRVTAYSKSGLVTPTVNVTLLNASNVVVKTFTTVDTDRGSTTNYSEIITDVPVTATQIRLNAGTPSYVYAELIDLSPYPPLTAVAYTTSQNIIVAETSSFALIGGGGVGRGWQSSSGPGGGGGSGRLVYGTVNAGTWPLVIGAGGIQSGNSNPSGGASTFAGSTANGGDAAPGGGGGAGGSGGGWSTQTNGVAGGAGGFNGNSGPGGGGAGSGVTANWFGVANSGGVPAGTSGAGGGGIYAGGAGGGGNFSDGLNANGFGGGGGGGGYQGGTGTTSRKGGNGGNGVLYILTQS